MNRKSGFRIKDGDRSPLQDDEMASDFCDVDSHAIISHDGCQTFMDDVHGMDSQPGHEQFEVYDPRWDSPNEEISLGPSAPAPLTCVDGSTKGFGQHAESQASPDIIYDVSSGFDRYTNYAPIIIHKNLCCAEIKDYSHRVNSLGSQLNIPAWEHELSYENDTNLRDYLDFGVKNGFLIVDVNSDISPYEGKNYSSAVKGEAYNCVNRTILDELAKGKYVIADTKPTCVHGLGAVPKREVTGDLLQIVNNQSGYQLIHTCLLLFMNFVLPQLIM